MNATGDLKRVLRNTQTLGETGMKESFKYKALNIPRFIPVIYRGLAARGESKLYENNHVLI